MTAAMADFNAGDLIRGTDGWGGIYTVVSGEGDVLYVRSLVGQYRLVNGADFESVTIGQLVRESRGLS